MFVEIFSSLLGGLIGTTILYIYCLFFWDIYVEIRGEKYFQGLVTLLWVIAYTFVLVLMATLIEGT